VDRGGSLNGFFFPNVSMNPENKLQDENKHSQAPKELSFAIIIL